MVAIEEDDETWIQRPFFQELAAFGQYQLGSQPGGWMKVGLKGLDMRGLRGLALTKGVKIKEGFLDADADVRLVTSDTFSTNLDLTFTDLSLTESSAGWLSKTLSLQTSLDTVIYALESKDGSIHLSLPFALEQGEVSRREFRRSAVRAATQVIAKAVERSHMKIGQVVTDTGRLITGKPKPRSELVTWEPVFLNYDAGVVMLSEAQQVQLRDIEATMRKNRHLTLMVNHELGAGDIQVAQRLTNPNLKDREELYVFLSNLREDMQQKYRDLRARAATAYRIGDVNDAQHMSELLTETDNHLSIITQAMGNLLEMTGPGGEHLKRRRTRQGALSLARSRLSILQDAILQFDVRKIEKRIQIAQPSYMDPKPGQPNRIKLTLMGRQVNQ